MGFNIVTRPFWQLPSLMDEDMEDMMTVSGLPGGVSVSEDDKQVYITASLPGVDEKDIDITYDKGILWIKGESKQEEGDKRKFYRRSTSSFAYSVAVPGDIDTVADPDATYKNGVMTVTFTKSPKSQPKKIAVKSGK